MTANRPKGFPTRSRMRLFPKIRYRLPLYTILAGLMICWTFTPGAFPLLFEAHAVTVGNTSELVDAVSAANGGWGDLTIELEDGTYTLYRILHIMAEGTTVKSVSGNREAVVLSREKACTGISATAFSCPHTISRSPGRDSARRWKPRGPTRPGRGQRRDQKRPHHGYLGTDGQDRLRSQPHVADFGQRNRRGLPDGIPGG